MAGAVCSGSAAQRGWLGDQRHPLVIEDAAVAASRPGGAAHVGARVIRAVRKAGVRRHDEQRSSSAGDSNHAQDQQAGAEAVRRQERDIRVLTFLPPPQSQPLADR
jgi:hypothetical protein